MKTEEFETKVLASLDRIIEMLEKTDGRIPETSTPETFSNRECCGDSDRSNFETRATLESSRWGNLGGTSGNGQRLARDLRQETQSNPRDNSRPERPFRNEIDRGLGQYREES